MSWFEKAKTVLIEALDIQDDEGKASATAGPSSAPGRDISGHDSPSNSPKGGPSSEVAGPAEVITTPPGDTSPSPSSPSFFDNPHANEMVTIPPRASDPSTSATRDTTPTSGLGYAKRQSATSDSVDLLSSPSPTSPLSPGDIHHMVGAKRTSESSLELITATTASELEMSPDTEPSLPDSIVIIASNETSDNAEGDGEEDDLDGDGEVAPAEEEVEQVVEVERQLEDHLNDSTKTMKALAFSDTQAAGNVTGADSDSTQSFEDIQMQLSHQKSAKGAPGRAKSVPGPAGASGDVVDQSYSSTSSDIEIISNPNGDSSTNSTATRTSPQKFKELAGPGIGVGVVGSGKMLGLKPKGHYREPSEISLLSEDSQSELDKLVQRISELNQVIEAREQRLLQSERQNAELLERNQELRARVEAAPDAADAAEAVQRLSALEKKFQASIRERDALRIQIKTLRDELLNKIPKDELTECNEMIQALQSEGEKLSKEILQQSTIIKKLRAKEKTSDTLLKKNGEQISLLSSESERLKKSLAAKEEMERTQIEAVCRMTSEKRRVDEENAESRSRIEDLQSRLGALQASFDGLKGDLQKRTRQEQDTLRAEQEEYVQQVSDLREKLRLAEHSLARREQQLREENRQLMRRLEAAELRAESSTHELGATTTPLIRQIEALQRTLDQRSAGWNREEQQLLQKLDDAQVQLRSVQQLESVQGEKQELLRTRCSLLEEKLSSALMETEASRMALRQREQEAVTKAGEQQSRVGKLEEQLQQQQARIAQLEKQLEQQHTAQRKPTLLTVEALKASNEFHPHMQTSQTHPGQTRNSPPLSLADDSGSNEEALGGIIDWQADDLDCASNSGHRQPSGLVQGVHLSFLSANTSTLEHLQALLKQRDGELTHLQWELSRLQAERAVLDGEISSLTIELETLKEKMLTYEAMERTYEDLQHRYDALLQMYGEKVERTEELELDLTELKSAYKLQIDELLANPPPNLQRPAKQT